MTRFRESVEKHEKGIIENGLLIAKDKKIEELLPEPARDIDKTLQKDKGNIESESLKDKGVSVSDNVEAVTERLSNIDLNSGTSEVHLKDDCNVVISDSLEGAGVVVKSKETEFIAEKIASEISSTVPEISLYDKQDEVCIEKYKIIEVTDDVKTKDELNRDDVCRKIENAITDMANEQQMSLSEHKGTIDKKIVDKNVSKQSSAVEVANTKNVSSTDNGDKITPKDSNKYSLSSQINDGKPKEQILDESFPFGDGLELDNGQITLESIERNKRQLLAKLKENLSKEDINNLNCFSMKDIDIDSPDYVNEKVANVGFDSKDKYEKIVNSWGEKSYFKPYYLDGKGQNGKEFDFDYQPNLEGHPGPSPSVILQVSYCRFLVRNS